MLETIARADRSSIARRAAISSASTSGSSASAWTPSRRAIVEDAAERRALFERFVVLAAASRRSIPGPSASPASEAYEFAPMSQARSGGGRRMNVHDRTTGSTSARVDDVPLRGARIVRRARAATSPIFRTADDQVFALRDKLPAQGRAAQPGHRPRPRRSPARCTTGSSTSRPARRRARTTAART